MYNNNNNNNSGYGGGYNNNNSNNNRFGGGGGYNQQQGGFNQQQQGGYNNQQQGGFNQQQGGYQQQGGSYNNNQGGRPQQQQQYLIDVDDYGGGNGYNNNNNNNSNNNGLSSYDDNGFSPEYQATTKNIHQITVAVSTLTRLVQQLGTPKDTMEVRDKIRTCVSSTTQLISSESSKVKTLTSLASRARDQKTKLSYQKLVKEYNACLQQFQEIAQVATKKERSTPLPQQNKPQPQQQQQQQQQFGRYGGNNQFYEEEENDTERENQSLLEASRRQQLSQVESEREYQNSIIQEREDGIRQIEQSIVEINEIFMDLSNLVSEQGVMLNTIEHSLESTVMNTQEGVVQIKQASQHQRSARTKMCWLALILFIVAGVLAVILYFTIKK
ncbi:syntaxin 7 [Cavenderia fasciculata]|uniref:Syntaxin 7 n=1 Tax=Cavenderia fasciculata TaxID=261658 RepID=F4PQ27_CACFS|nr:syntaxin 7 [Cavenderia fasciculata]EGG22490.1 syntaxin 7 [Cavenderia fasciculata]|eukprot:XP_004360341.1 syntaxin 7 [Cavenderia fasciculata]